MIPNAENSSIRINRYVKWLCCWLCDKDEKKTIQAQTQSWVLFTFTFHLYIHTHSGQWCVRSQHSLHISPIALMLLCKSYWGSWVIALSSFCSSLRSIIYVSFSVPFSALYFHFFSSLIHSILMHVCVRVWEKESLFASYVNWNTNVD